MFFHMCQHIFCCQYSYPILNCIRDLYKIIVIDKDQSAKSRGFELLKELSKDSQKSKSFIIPQTELPTEIVFLRFKPESKNTAELYLNNGWSLSFRLHNDSSFVEPSLLFDIQFVGVPVNIVSADFI